MTKMELRYHQRAQAWCFHQAGRVMCLPSYPIKFFALADALEAAQWSRVEITDQSPMR